MIRKSATLLVLVVLVSVVVCLGCLDERACSDFAFLTGDVSEFEMGFYDTYNINPEQYEMNNLQLLPHDNWDLWTKGPLEGERYIR
jgi:hypothetical protein